MEDDYWTSIRLRRSTANLVKNLALELTLKMEKATNADEVIHILFDSYQAQRLKAERAMQKGEALLGSGT